MRLSDAMEAGYAKVGKQTAFLLWDGMSPFNPEKVCALGAANYGQSGCAMMSMSATCTHAPAEILSYITRLNDHCKMPIPEIVETLRGMGL